MADSLKPEDIQRLHLFIKACRDKPEILHHKQLQFFKDYLLSLGATLPKDDGFSKHRSQPFSAPPRDEPMQETEPEEEEEEESDVELNNEGVIEAETMAFPEIGESGKVVTEEDIDASQEKRAEAMSAMSDGDLQKAVDLFTEAIKINPGISQQIYVDLVRFDMKFLWKCIQHYPEDSTPTKIIYVNEHGLESIHLEEALQLTASSLPEVDKLEIHFQDDQEEPEAVTEDEAEDIAQNCPEPEKPAYTNKKVLYDRLPTQELDLPDITTYQIIRASSSLKKDRLYDNLGYSYIMRRANKDGSKNWRCPIRNKDVSYCPAGVKQVGESFESNNQQHNHPPKIGLLTATEVNMDIKKRAAEDQDKSTIAIIEEVMQEKHLVGNPCPALPSVDTIVRVHNKHRKRFRTNTPKKQTKKEKKANMF